MGHRRGVYDDVMIGARKGAPCKGLEHVSGENVDASPSLQQTRGAVELDKLDHHDVLPSIARPPDLSMCRIRTDARVRNRRLTLCEAAGHMGSERHPEHASALPEPSVWCVGRLDGHWSSRNPRARAYTSLVGVAVPNGDDILLPVYIL